MMRRALPVVVGFSLAVNLVLVVGVAMMVLSPSADHRIASRLGVASTSRVSGVEDDVEVIRSSVGDLSETVGGSSSSATCDDAASSFTGVPASLSDAVASLRACVDDQQGTIDDDQGRLDAICQWARGQATAFIGSDLYYTFSDLETSIGC
jgi:hypothetical protein